SMTTGGALLDDDRFFFFFQAEDGIRDFHVTGVQTCALPISDLSDTLPLAGKARVVHRVCAQNALTLQNHVIDDRAARPPLFAVRSEERRVGKESRARGSSSP